MKAINVNKTIPWVLAIFVAFVFLQSLFFKFSGSGETVIIFSTIGQWMADIGFPLAFADAFTQHGGITVGTAELIASILILIPKTRIFGAILGFCIISGAIFFHLFTPLGVDRIVDAAGNTDGGVLFMMAVAVWLCCSGLIYQFFRSHQQSSTFAGADVADSVKVAAV